MTELEIGKRIAQTRMNKGITLAEMAYMLGFKSVSNYWYLEHGQRKISIERGQKIADILQVPFEDLFLPHKSENN